MAGLIVLDRARHVELFGPSLDEAQALVDREQFRAKAEDGDVDGYAAFCAEMSLGCGEHLFAEAGALMCGIDCELTEVAAIAVGLCVDAGDGIAFGVFREEDFPFLHHGGETLVVGAGALKESFDGEGGIDERDETRAVGGCGEADVEAERICHDAVDEGISSFLTG